MDYKILGIIDYKILGIIDNKIPGIIDDEIPGIIDKKIPGIIHIKIDTLTQTRVKILLLQFAPGPFAWLEICPPETDAQVAFPSADPERCPGYFPPGRFSPRGSAGISHRKSSKPTGNIDQNLYD